VDDVTSDEAAAAPSEGADDQTEDETIENGSREPPRVSGARVIGGIVITLAVLVIVVFFIGRLAGFGDLRRVLREGDWRWLAVCAAGQFVVFAGYSGVFRTSLGFEGGPHVPTGLALRVVLTSFALSQVIAAGGAAGLAVTYWALRRLGLHRREAVVRLLGLNTVVYLVFSMIAVAAAVLCLVTAAAPLGATLPLIVLIPSLWLAAWWFTDTRRVTAWSHPAGGALRRALSAGVAAAWWARRVAASRPGRPTLLWAALYWTGDIASLWGALHAFGESPSLVALALVYVLGYLAAAVPIPFIATGGMDAALTFSLQMVGVPLDTALVAVIAHRVFAFWLPLIPGLVFALLLRRTGAALDEARTRSEGAETNADPPAPGRLRPA
jgi:uncharacterized membrane protein YbhN (UPF0104 family)